MYDNEEKENEKVEDDKTTTADLSEAEAAAKKSKDLAGYWVGQVNTSEEERKSYEVECREAWREYQNETRADPRMYRAPISWNCSNFPRYWSDTETIAPTIYSNPPILIGERAFNAVNLAARAASIQVERYGEWALKCFQSHQTFLDGCNELLNTNRLAYRVCFESEIVKKPIRVEVFQVPGLDGQPIWVNEKNESAPEGIVVIPEGTKNYYEKEGTEEAVKSPKVFARVVRFDELLISPGARAPEDIWWMAYKVTCTRKKAVELFGAEKVKTIVGKIETMKNEDESGLKNTEDLFQYYELWNKRDKKIYYLTTNFTEGWLKEPDDDIYGLRGFFPSPPFIYSSKRFDSLYPVPDYTQVRDSYEQLHILSRRINEVIRAIKAAVIYDGSQPELVSFFKELTDNTGIACEKYADFIDKGGFERLVAIPDFSKMGMVLNNLVSSFNAEELKLDRIRGLPEIVRGQANQNLTLGQDKMNKAASTSRNSTRQRNFEFGLRDLVEMLVDLMLAKGKIPDETLAIISGKAHGDQQYQDSWEAGLAILRDDEMRLAQVSIETDSTSLIKQTEKREDALMLLDKVGSYVNNIAATVLQTPATAPALFSLLDNAVRAMGQGKYVETEVRRTFGELMQVISQPPPTPAQPPPDPKLIQIESNERIAQMKIQLETQKLMLDKQALDMQSMLNQFRQFMEDRKQTHKEAVDVSNAQIKDGALALDARVIQTDETFRGADLTLKAENQAADNARLEAEAVANIENPPTTETSKAGVVINVGNNKDPNEVASVVKDPLTGQLKVKLPENPL